MDDINSHSKLNVNQSLLNMKMILVSVPGLICVLHIGLLCLTLYLSLHPHSCLSGVQPWTKKCLVSLSPTVTHLLHCLKPLYSKYVGLVYTVHTEITSDPRHLPYFASTHWAV